MILLTFSLVNYTNFNFDFGDFILPAQTDLKTYLITQFLEKNNLPFNPAEWSIEEVNQQYLLSNRREIYYGAVPLTFKKVGPGKTKVDQIVVIEKSKDVLIWVLVGFLGLVSLCSFFYLVKKIKKK
ncbi:hypothetical protein [Williamsoniiplasma lucivorax]|uniref:Uncharacterized protein n=1 Tax=Williamsoniiplasma lucivorax TaxID=209274 RepID=A0A2S5RGA9_9MOLU|nr:hypothetical protein [Williamsoniiplasma lucivorax]PPE06165.1 hypothetical protein ELUCI_v1c04560 [Williamsoniiplasma lucivorax]